MPDQTEPLDRPNLLQLLARHLIPFLFVSVGLPLIGIMGYLVSDAFGLGFREMLGSKQDGRELQIIGLLTCGVLATVGFLGATFWFILREFGRPSPPQVKA